MCGCVHVRVGVGVCGVGGCASVHMCARVSFDIFIIRKKLPNCGSG